MSEQYGGLQHRDRDLRLVSFVVMALLVVAIVAGAFEIGRLATQLSSANNKVDALSARLDGKFDAMSAKLDAMGAKVDTLPDRIDRQFQAGQGQIAAQTNAIANSITAARQMMQPMMFQPMQVPMISGQPVAPAPEAEQPAPAAPAARPTTQRR